MPISGEGGQSFTILLSMCERCFVLCMQSGRTLLHFAAQLGHHEAVECLLEKKADADAKDKVNNIKIQVHSKVH